MPKDFIYRVLNKIFLDSLASRNSLFLKEYFNISTKYMCKNNIEKIFSIYVSMYLFYFLNNHKEDAYKYCENIKMFINSSSLISKERTEINIENWKNEIRNILKEIRLMDVCSLIPTLLETLSYEINFKISDDIYEFLINSWLELLFSRYYEYEFNENDFIIMLNKLDDKYKELLSKTLNKEWLNESDDFLQGKTCKYLEFYGIDSDIDINNNDKIIKSLINFKNDYLFTYYKTKILLQDNEMDIVNTIKAYIDEEKTRFVNLNGSILCDEEETLIESIFLKTEFNLNKLKNKINVNLRHFIEEKQLNNCNFNIIIDDSDIIIDNFNDDLINEYIDEKTKNQKNDLFIFKYLNGDTTMRFLVKKDRFSEILKKALFIVKIIIHYGKNVE